MSGSPNGPDAQRSGIGVYDRLRDALPRPIARYVMHFEASLEDAVEEFARTLAEGARILDAGAGEGAHKKYFTKHRYCGVDLAVGDRKWDYSKLDVIGNLEAIPLRTGSFDACLNIVTLEHVERPRRVVCEMARVLAPGGKLLIVAPLEWEEHQQPHDYFRYTRYGLEMLLKQAGMVDIAITPVGGFFRLLSRRLFNGLRFFPGPLMILAAIFLVPPALIVPLFDSLDRERNFTLGYICSARKAA